MLAVIVWTLALGVSTEHSVHAFHFFKKSLSTHLPTSLTFISFLDYHVSRANEQHPHVNLNALLPAWREENMDDKGGAQEISLQVQKSFC